MLILIYILGQFIGFSEGGLTKDPKTIWKEFDLDKTKYEISDRDY